MKYSRIVYDSFMPWVLGLNTVMVIGSTDAGSERECRQELYEVHTCLIC